ncbi:7514_t:CDS:1 [Diversispora eburnea]|uniref:Dihydrofolate reductase n=1 Tax=Diversispora eburnea TaxID=1213867 RepID=A0A9N8V331_9GLOM|nr:7514_t:CDS:1 [Diversispora eburnea]
MGRLTWESIPEKYQPLKNRLNIIISSRMKSDDDSNKGGYLIYPSLEKAIQDLEIDLQIFRIFIIGGSKLYEEAINSTSCKYILLTKIYKEFKCDRFFPQIDENVYSLVDHLELEKFVGETVPQGKQLDSDIEYEFLMYKRIK